AESNTELTPETIAKVIDAGIETIEIFFPDKDDAGPVMSLTVKKDTIKSPQEALIEIYRKMRPGDPPTLETSQALFHGMFFDARKLAFPRAGATKFNIKGGGREPGRQTTPCPSPKDFFAVMDYARKLKKRGGRGEPVTTADGRTIYYADDDIDHLGNRRVRAV